MWKRGKLWHEGRDRTDVLTGVTRAAMHVKRLLGHERIPTWVEAVLVSTQAPVIGSVSRRGWVTVLDAQALAEFVRTRQRRWDADMVERAARAI